VDLLAVLVALGLSSVANVVMAVALIFIIRNNRAVACEAMNSVLAASNMPALELKHTLFERSMKKLQAKPIPRERRVIH